MAIDFESVPEVLEFAGHVEAEVEKRLLALQQARRGVRELSSRLKAFTHRLDSAERHEGEVLYERPSREETLGSKGEGQDRHR